VKLICALLSISSIWSSSANAAEYVMTFTGQARLLSDERCEFCDLFGPSGIEKFSLTLSLTQPLPSATNVVHTGDLFSEGTRLWGYGAANPLQVTMRIGNISVFSPSRLQSYSEITQSYYHSAGGNDLIGGYVYANEGTVSVSIAAQDILSKADFSETVSISGISNRIGGRAFYVGNWSPDDLPTLSLDIQSFSSTTVPEPGTWLMMLLGIAGLGAALRRLQPYQAEAIIYA